MADLISRSALVDDLRALRDTMGSVFYKMVVDRCIGCVEAQPAEVVEQPPVGATDVVWCNDCVHYEFPEEGDFLGRCTCGILAISNSGEIYPGRGFYCLYGERRSQ